MCITRTNRHYLATRVIIYVYWGHLKKIQLMSGEVRLPLPNGVEASA